MKNVSKGPKNMWKPLSIATLAVIVLTGCSSNNPAEQIGGGGATATAVAQDNKEDAKANVDENSDVEGLKSNIDPKKVEVPEDIKKKYEDNADTLVAEATDFAAVIDNQGFLQDPDTDPKTVEDRWRAAIGTNMTPDVKDQLWDDINDENGSSLVAMWTGDNTATVDGKTYELTGDPWVFLYGDPVITDVEDSEIGEVKYAHQVRYHIPVTDEEGTQKWLTTDVTRTYNLTPGYKDQPWVVTGMWASAPTAYKIQDVKETNG